MMLPATWRVDGGWVGTPVQGWPFLAPLLPFYNVSTNRMQDTEALPSFELGKVYIPREKEATFPKTKKKCTTTFQKNFQQHLIGPVFNYADTFHMVGIYLLRFSTTGIATCNILLGSNKGNREKLNGKAGKHAVHTGLGRSKRNNCKALSLILGISVKQRLFICKTLFSF